MSSFVWPPLPSGSGVTDVTASSPLASSGGTTPNLTLQNADATHTGALTSTDWSTFNNKQNALDFSADKQVRFNSSGSLSGSANFTFDTATSILTLGTDTAYSKSINNDFFGANDFHGIMFNSTISQPESNFFFGVQDLPVGNTTSTNQGIVESTAAGMDPATTKNTGDWRRVTGANYGTAGTTGSQLFLTGNQNGTSTGVTGSFQFQTGDGKTAGGYVFQVGASNSASTAGGYSLTAGNNAGAGAGGSISLTSGTGTPNGSISLNGTTHLNGIVTFQNSSQSVDESDTILANSSYKKITPNILPQINDNTTVADVAGSLASTFFHHSTAVDLFYIWYKVSGVGTDPAPPGEVGIEVDIIIGASANDVATATRAAMTAGALGEFTISGATNHVIITNSLSGPTGVDYDGTAATGFTFNETQAGVLTVTLSATQAIADGATVGQIMYIENVSTSGQLVFPDSAKFYAPNATDLVVDPLQNLWVMWNGAAWNANHV